VRSSMPAVSGFSDDELYAALARSQRWLDMWAASTLRLVDALRAGDFADLGQTGRQLRRELQRAGVRGEVLRVVVGLSVMRAQKILAPAMRESFRDYVSTCRANAERAKSHDLFPWRLLDG
jgi:lambda repressor-like predicted transcriptional regulator